MLPMYQSEAMWVYFHSHSRYPFLVKIATGKINAVTGNQWQDRPVADPQDYLVVPTQPWLDGYCVEKGEIRQFVAMNDVCLCISESSTSMGLAPGGQVVKLGKKVTPDQVREGW